MGIIRQYDFDATYETPNQPPVGSPSSSGDLITKGYADGAYVETTGDEAVSGIKTFEKEVGLKYQSAPSNPASGYLKVYPKSDGKFYSKDSAGVEERLTPSGVYATLADDDTFTGLKSFDREVIYKHISTPSNPASGFLKVYAKSDDKMYKLNSAGTEVSMEGGGGGGSTNYNLRSVEGGGTTTLVVADNPNQSFLLNADQIVELPTTGVSAGDVWKIQERGGEFVLQVQSSDAENIMKLCGQTQEFVALQATPTDSPHWAPAETVSYLENDFSAGVSIGGSAGSSWDTFAVIPVNPGLWRLRVQTVWGGTFSVFDAFLGISTDTSGSFSDGVYGKNKVEIVGPATNINTVIVEYVVNVAVTTNYYVKTSFNNGTSVAVYGVFSAERLHPNRD